LLQNSQPKKLRDNQFIDNAEVDLRNEGVGDIQAANNWWGTAEEQEIVKMIQDRRSNSEWGEVHFRPWLSEPPALTQDKATSQ